MFFTNYARKVKGKIYLCAKITEMNMNDEILPRGVQRIQLSQNVDERGALSFLEGGKDIPFKVERVFWITDVPEGQMRGAHAHWTCHEALFPVTGSFEIEVDDGERCCTLQMNRPNEGILISAGVWCELRHFAPGTACIVMASQPYDASGYAHDRAEWRRMVKGIAS